MIVTDVSQLPDRHKVELLRGERVRAELAILEQRRLKEASDLLETRHIEGLGQKVLCITREMAARLRMKYGMGCLHDPAFRKRLLEKNPFLRVRSIPQKTTIRVDGFKEGFRVQDSGFRGEVPDHGAQRDAATALRQGTRFAHETTSGVSPAEPLITATERRRYSSSSSAIGAEAAAR